MERAVPSLKWKTTASAACIPRRDSTSPYSMAAIVLPTASRTVCSLFSGLGGPIILGCSPLLACWLSMLLRLLEDDLFLPTPRISYPCLAVSPVLGASSTLLAGGSGEMAAPACSLRCARYAASASCLVPPSAFAFPTLQVVLVLRLPVSDQLFAAALVLRDGLAAHSLNVARGEFDRDAVGVLSSSKLDRPVRQSAACLFRGHSFAPSIHEGILPPTRPARAAPPFSITWPILTARRRPRAAQHGSEVPSRLHFPGYVTTFNPGRNVAIPPNPPGGIIVIYYTKY